MNVCTGCLPLPFAEPDPQPMGMVARTRPFADERSLAGSPIYREPEPEENPEPRPRPDESFEDIARRRARARREPGAPARDPEPRPRPDESFEDIARRRCNRPGFERSFWDYCLATSRGDLFDV